MPSYEPIRKGRALDPFKTECLVSAPQAMALSVLTQCTYVLRAILTAYSISRLVFVMEYFH
jgi:hypothetical protein